jgi:hypothetical protein
MKTKLIVVIVLTLVIGFILGVLTSAQMRFHRLKPVRMYFSEERFREGFFNAIQPDDKQKAKIDLILDKYAKIIGDLQGNFRKEFDEKMNEFRKEIDSNLTKEQIARLKEMDEKRQEMIRQNRMNRMNDTTNSHDNMWNNPNMRHGPGPGRPGEHGRGKDSINR